MNLDQFEKVDYLPPTQFQYTNIRGYGGIHLYNVTKTTLDVTSQPYNRLENLQQPFGQHHPEHAQKKYNKAIGQSTIAWK